MAARTVPQPASVSVAVMTQDMSELDYKSELFLYSTEKVHDFVVHTLYPWGERWSGTKAQLQSIGIGVGIAYPGEPSGNKRIARTTNSQGDDLELEAYNDVVFYASLDYCKSSFTAHDAPVEFAPGVLLVRHHSLYGYLNAQDEYRGSGNALTACGLVTAGQFPGSPGRGKTRCSFFADGRKKTTSGSVRRQAGDYSIERRSKGFSIFVEAVRTEHEAESWQQKYALHRSEREKACAAIRAKRNPASDTATTAKTILSQHKSVDDIFLGMFQNITDEQIDCWVAHERESYQAAIRAAAEAKAARRNEAYSIASTDGVVIFPKIWHCA